MKGNQSKRPINDSLKNYARGITGGLLFSFPLLYTMEVWWAGFIATPFALLVLICVTFLLLLGYNRFAGMRPDVSWKAIIIDSIEEMGIGLIISFAVLLMLNRIQPASMVVDEILGKTIIEAMAVSIGVSIGTAQLGAGKGEGKEDENGSEKRTGKMAIAVLALCGSIVVGGNVAPTEEVLMIAIEAEPVHILMMAVVSLLLSTIVTYFSDFKGTSREKPDNLAYHLILDTCMCYTIALGASAFVLWFFGRFENISFWNVFSQCIVLGVLSSLGASAGRLLIK